MKAKIAELKLDVQNIKIENYNLKEEKKKTFIRSNSPNVKQFKPGNLYQSTNKKPGYQDSPFLEKQIEKIISDRTERA